ncbi:valine--tRNA ligase [bacterium]|nr:valine--tRNA ligase [bacterium]
MTKETRFNYAEIEARIYEMWREKGCFQSAINSQGVVVDEKKHGKNPYVISIPPPNVTGRLHMGHALNNTFQDMLIRYKRMDGYDALWVPGTDHAGIATQTVVKKMLDAEGIDYRELGREKFIEKIWEWKQKFGGIILQQLEKLGCSCDWDRTRFTMDEGLSKAVVKTFKTLFDEGLIYRGKRIVNWCPVDRTALSDDEVETKEGGEPGFLWHIKYLYADGTGHVVVATTRPETLFGDVAVAVNPKDERYTKLVGKNVILPLQERVIPVIADEYVDMAFGTGCLKITPAHDPNDFEIGSRHKLEPINVMHEDARMNDVVPERYRGLDRYICREKAIEELKKKGLLVLEEERMTPIGRSYRSKAAIEYRLSDQWFVKMKPLAEKVLEKHSELNIVPQRWNKVYLEWLHNIRDWCISRQIWWGHRIPAYYCVRDQSLKTKDQCQEACPPIVSETMPEKCPHCGNTNIEQETDVLDTWFSSSLWPMSTLGWPEETPDFERYFPTTTLVTAKDIIFFWVARMNMMSVHFTGKLPFKNVFLNPVVLDEKGETMSKSKGNGIDPLVVINGSTLEDLKHPVMEARPSNMKEIIKRLEKTFPEGFEGVGADALRYTLIYLSSSGQQLKVSLNSFQDLGRRFMTKLWNAARFIMMYVEQENEKGDSVSIDFTAHITDEDKWIHTRAQLAANKVRECFDNHDFTNLGQHYYQYVWNDFCDWYIELCKVRLISDDAVQRKTALHNLITAFAKTLIILHPLIPHITEELWSKILPLGDKNELWGSARPTTEILMQASFIEKRDIAFEEQVILERFECLKEFVSDVRTLRKSYNIKEAQNLSAHAYALDDAAKHLLAQSQATISRLAHISDLTVLKNRDEKPGRTVAIIHKSYEIYLDVSEYVDVEKEKARLSKEIQKLDNHIVSLNKRLQNRSFVENASSEVVAEQRESLSANKEKLQKLEQLLTDIASW